MERRRPGAVQDGDLKGHATAIGPCLHELQLAGASQSWLVFLCFWGGVEQPLFVLFEEREGTSCLQGYFIGSSQKTLYWSEDFD